MLQLHVEVLALLETPLSVSDDLSPLKILGQLTCFVLICDLTIHRALLPVDLFALFEVLELLVDLLKFKLLFFPPNPFALLDELPLSLHLLEPNLFNPLCLKVLSLLDR